MNTTDALSFVEIKACVMWIFCQPKPQILKPRYAAIVLLSGPVNVAKSQLTCVRVDASMEELVTVQDQASPSHSVVVNQDLLDHVAKIVQN